MKVSVVRRPSVRLSTFSKLYYHHVYCNKNNFISSFNHPLSLISFTHRRSLRKKERKKEDEKQTCSENKGDNQLAVTAKLICVIVFAYGKKPVFSRRGSIILAIGAEQQ